jgi:hypothetical protein
VGLQHFLGLVINLQIKQRIWEIDKQGEKLNAYNFAANNLQCEF